MLNFVPAKEVSISLDNAVLDAKEKHDFHVLNPMGLLHTSPLKVKTWKIIQNILQCQQQKLGGKHSRPGSRGGCININMDGTWDFTKWHIEETHERPQKSENTWKIEAEMLWF